MSNLNTCKMDIWAIPDEDEALGFRLMLMPPERSFWMSDDNVRMGTTVINFQPPDDMSRDQMIRKAVETLRDKQNMIRAQAERRVAELNDKINKMMMLTHQPDPGNVVEIIPRAANGDFETEDDLPF